MARNDEHTLNTALAECLRGKSPAWKPAGAVTSESLGTLEGGGRPDILVTPAHAPPVVLETEVEPAPTVEKDAEERLDRRLKSTGKPIRYAVAVRLPDALREAPEGELPYQVGRARARYAVLSSDPPAEATSPPGAAAGRSRFPRQGWIQGDVDDLAGLVENIALSERALARSTDILETAIRHAAGRLREGLHDRPAILQEIGDLLHQDPGVQTDRMAMAIVANACCFHNGVAGSSDAKQIRSLDQLRMETGTLPKNRVLEEWRAILRINYWPIFAIARNILVGIPSRVAAQVLDVLAKTADALEAEGVTRSHDLTGRMFQKLIQDRKFLATFYTRPEAATLLAELAVGMMDADWDDPEAMGRIRVGDLACGTGTLLLAAYHSLTARCRRAGGNDAALHRTMIEKCLIGADIMPAAAHLTASMLSSVHPAIPYDRTQIYTLPYGNDPQVARLCLGSLSLLESEQMPSLFGTGLSRGMRGLGGTEEVEVQETASSSFAMADGSLDLVIMNPPFTRPTNHEATDEAVPSFAGFGTTKAEQDQMSKELQRLRRIVKRRRKKAGDAPPASHGNAGLPSNFLDLAHAKLRPGGVLAVVLPLSMAQGAASEASRQLFARHYRDIMILTLAGARSEDKCFSADTGMGEMLLLARKRPVRSRSTQDARQAAATWIILKRRPRSAAEAGEIARSIRQNAVAIRSGSRQALDVAIGGDTLGAGLPATLADGGMASVLDVSLADAALHLQNGVLPLPQVASQEPLPTICLSQIGQRGPVHRDVGGKPNTSQQARGPFKIVPLSGVPTFPALWGHDAPRERRLIVNPDSMGSVRTGRAADAAAVWRTASRLHFNLDFRLNSQSLAACLTPTRAIGGVAWPSIQPLDLTWEEPLAAWANTTLGLILFWWMGTTQQSGRTRLTVTRLPDLPVLDLRTLTPGQISDLSAAANTIAPMKFLPAHLAAKDPVRIELDRLVLKEVLGFRSDAMEQVALLRRKWCAEPTVHGGKKDRLAP